MQDPAKAHKPILDYQAADVAAIKHHELNDIFKRGEGVRSKTQLKLKTDHVTWGPRKLTQCVLPVGERHGFRCELPRPRAQCDGAFGGLHLAHRDTAFNDRATFFGGLQQHLVEAVAGETRAAKE